MRGWRPGLGAVLVGGFALVYLPAIALAASARLPIALAAAALGLVLGALLFWALARRIGRPLAALTAEAEAVRRLDLAAPVAVRTELAELEQLAGSVAGMKAALRLFSVYVPRDLVRKLMAEGAEAKLGGERRRVTIMFSDVAGFTGIAERMEPEALMQVTSAYFEALTAVLIAGHATIDKYVGDAVMAVWNAPRRDLAHAMHACHAVLRARRLTRALEQRFAAQGWPALTTRFGLHAGEAVLGNVGSTDRMAYTAIGSMVNLAARLEGMNKLYGTSILVSDAVRIAAGNAFVFRPVDLVLPKGAQEPLEIHELVGLAVAPDPADADLLADAGVVARLPEWREVVRRYRAGQFAAAAAALDAAGGAAGDALCAAYAERIATLGAGAPAGWSPVTRLERK